MTKRAADWRGTDICHRCAFVPDCQGCMEKVAYVEGIRMAGYAAKVKRLREDSEENHEIRTKQFLQDTQQDISKRITQFQKAGTNISPTVQLVHALFEAAAAIAALPHPGISEEDQEKLDVLRQSAADGMAVVNGYESDDDEESEDEM